MMPLYRFIKLMLVAPIVFFSGRNNMGVIDCLCVCVCVLFSRFL